MSDPIDDFHTHLDVCTQCREHPFDLCPRGVPLLKAAAEFGVPLLRFLRPNTPAPRNEKEGESYV
jgi:hypothetical protein